MSENYITKFAYKCKKDDIDKLESDIASLHETMIFPDRKQIECKPLKCMPSRLSRPVILFKKVGLSVKTISEQLLKAQSLTSWRTVLCWA